MLRIRASPSVTAAPLVIESLKSIEPAGQSYLSGRPKSSSCYAPPRLGKLPPPVIPPEREPGTWGFRALAASAARPRRVPANGRQGKPPTTHRHQHRLLRRLQDVLRPRPGQLRLLRCGPGRRWAADPPPTAG